MDGVYTPKELDEDFERLVPRFLNLPYGSKESKEVADKIREFYFKNRSFDGKTFKEYVDVSFNLDLNMIFPFLQYLINFFFFYSS